MIQRKEESKKKRTAVDCLAPIHDVRFLIFGRGKKIPSNNKRETNQKHLKSHQELLLLLLLLLVNDFSNRKEREREKEKGSLP